MKKNWWKESIVYQIYPKSFNDSNGDGIGDIRGIIEKLDYLKELGVNVLWISPMLESPQDDNGYDISDYRRIYKDYGTMQDYEELLFQAHERGIKVLMDLVVNHTSDEHQWFLESKKSKDNPYRDYYIWKNPVNGKEPNNWGGAFGGSAWEYDNETQMYYLHLFSKKQPDLNWENEKVRQEVYDMMKFWCDKGIDGFRMDVISMISKDQAFPDGEVKSGLYGDFGPYSVHGPRVHEFLQEMNREVLSKYDIMTVGETSGVTIEEAQKYAGEDSGELNMVFQFEHVEDASPHAKFGKWTTDRYDFKAFKKTMIKWQEELQGKAWNSLFLGNHDQPRSVSRFGNDNPAYRETSAKMLATCLHMMQGTPYVYQGEELGMTNAYFHKLEDYKDIESIQYYTELTDAGLMEPDYMMKCLMLRSRDNARTPMQWDGSEKAGFTDGEPWIKINPNCKEINAASQLDDPDSIFHYYQKLIALRKEKEIIVYGEFEPLCREDDQIFAYMRKLDEERLLTVWKKVLNLENAGVEDDFFESGGDSLKAMELLSAIKKELNWDTLLLTDILRSNTIRALSDFYISGGKKSILRKMSDISSDKQDAYFIHGGNGSADSYGYIIASAKDRYNCYGIDYLHEVKLAPEKISLKALAEEYAQEIMKNTPFDKSIMLVGWCIGGTICYEIAYILEQNGYKDINIRFFDTQAPGANMEYSYTVSGEIEFIKQYTSDMDTDALSDVENITLLWEKVVEMLERDSELKARVMKSFAEETAGVLMNTENMSVHEAMMINNFFRSLVDAAEKVSISGKLYYADAVYVHADKQSVTDHPEKWQEHFDRSVKFINVNETHFGILQTKDNKDLKI